jgi:hypothetical protein
MSSHYLTGALTALLGSFVVVISQAFTPSVLGWVAFGVAIAIASSALLAQLDRSRGAVQRTLDGATVVVAVLLIIFSLTASGRAETWLSFALSLGIVGLAYAGLTVHEVMTRHIPVNVSAMANHKSDTMIATPQGRAA